VWSEIPIAGRAVVTTVSIVGAGDNRPTFRSNISTP
jgi:hypothetical protein